MTIVLYAQTKDPIQMVGYVAPRYFEAVAAKFKGTDLEIVADRYVPLTMDDCDPPIVWIIDRPTTPSNWTAL